MSLDITASGAYIPPNRRQGVLALRPGWLVLKRGAQRERRDADAYLIGDATDEVPVRGVWRDYRELMEAT
jgi:hypothetical protein